MREAGLTDLSTVVAAARRIPPRSSAAPARLYLVSRTSHLAEGWCDKVPELELAGDASLRDAVREAARSLGVALVWESPADVIPLPAAFEERSLVTVALAEATRPAAIGDAGSGTLEVRHFDPYSVVLRLIARGDEPDYVAALEYVLHGWVEPARLEGLLAEVVPRMTSETLAQDPAEFRRKFKGLRQLYLRSHTVYSPGGTRAGEAVSQS
jgi:hypothetical protein